VPLVDVTYDESLTEESLAELRRVLPGVVAEAVDCPDDRSTGPPEPGDIEIRFRRKGPLDVGELDVVVEVRTKRYDSRARDAQRRADLIAQRLSDLRLGRTGIWLILCEGAWSQT
jgi:hypothetical protein